MSDSLDLACRQGLPDAWLILRDRFPRSRWGEAGLNPVAAHWLQMHAGFRHHSDHMRALTAAFRADPGDPRALHARLIPALQAFLQHLDGHHRIESGHYFPIFRRIEPDIAAGIDLLDRDHDAVHAHLHALFEAGRGFHRAVAGNAPDAASLAHRLADALDEALPSLTRHLDDEEDIVIPLIALRGEVIARGDV